HTYNDTFNALPPGGAYGIYSSGGPGGTATNGDWDSEQGSWLVHTLPYMAQNAMYKLSNPRPGIFNPAGATPMNYLYNGDPGTHPLGPGTRKDVPFPGDGQGGIGKIPLAQMKLPYGRCPSDDYDPDQTVVNYVASLGPQCAIGPCGANPFQKYCKPRYSGL